MRRLLSTLLVLVSAAGLTAGLGGTASADVLSQQPCSAYADPPLLRVGETRIYTNGSFTCDEAAFGMTMTVCIQEQYAVDGQWWDRSCKTVKDLYELRESLETTHSISAPVYATFLRATVTGKNARNEVATYSSPPVYWFNCACYIG